MFTGRHPFISVVGTAVLALTAALSPVVHGQSPSGAGNSPRLLTLSDAIDRGLRFNLDLIESTLTAGEARAERMRALSALLPSVSVRGAAFYEDLSLQELGIHVPDLPPTTGGFGYQDVRIGVSQSLYDRERSARHRSSEQSERAAELSARDAHEVVILAVGRAYLQIVAASARLDTAGAELRSAQEFDRQAEDRVNAGVSAEIDSLRARVERQTAEQLVVDTTNAFEKSRLTLARIIGLSIDETFSVQAPDPGSARQAVSEESARARALASRSDLAAAAARIDAADLDLRARRAQNGPTVGLTANYGAGGALPHLDQVYAAGVIVSVPLYTGGRVHAEALVAENVLAKRRAEYEDLKRGIALDVRAAWLDLAASESAVAVADRNKELADRAETQALDRYGNGVTNYLEVVQARETVVHADEMLVASHYRRDLATLTLARTIGDVSSTVKELFRHDY